MLQLRVTKTDTCSKGDTTQGGQAVATHRKQGIEKPEIEVLSGNDMRQRRALMIKDARAPLHIDIFVEWSKRCVASKVSGWWETSQNTVLQESALDVHTTHPLHTNTS